MFFLSTAHCSAKGQKRQLKKNSNYINFNLNKRYITMTNSRFDIDLSEVSTERLICPAGTYEARIAKAELRTGTKDEKNWAILNLT